MISKNPALPTSLRNPSFPDISLLEMARNQLTLFLKLSGFASTDQSCVFGSYYLAMLFRRFSEHCSDVEVCGGGLCESTGVLTPLGSLQKHMWVRVLVDREAWFIDITADQFGFPEMVYGKEIDLQQIFRADAQVETRELLRKIETDSIFQKMAQLQ